MTRHHPAVVRQFPERLRHLLGATVATTRCSVPGASGWDEQQPVGTHVTFGAKELVESGDANLAALLRVHDWICETVSELRGGDSPTA